ncbi:hypothetical protein ACNFIA_25250 [Pseudomonas sp. NY15437]|uniref:hypothetical protein n=1 Tax=Pseudomonas sp. NY15437 TaxID=3400360 RepID=UPI003A85EC36
MRQPSIHHLQGQVFALQAQLNALFASLPPLMFETVHEHLQRQADLARVEIINTVWGGPVMRTFDSALMEFQLATTAQGKDGHSSTRETSPLVNVSI